MTDPVDTDEMRAFGQGLKQRARTESGRMLVAAGDELDRLRASNATLQAVIENAPHDVGCASPAESLLGATRDPNRRCTCWKADAL